MATTMDTLVINIQSTTDSATKSIGKLIASFKKLQDELDKTINKSNGLSSLKNIKVGTSATRNLSKVKKANNEEPKLIAKNIKEFDKFKDLQTSSMTLNKDVSNLRTELNKMNIDVSKFSLDEVFESSTKETRKYKNELEDILTINRKMKKGVPIYNVGLKQSGLTPKENKDKLTGASIIDTKGTSEFTSFTNEVLKADNGVSNLNEQLNKLGIDLSQWKATSVMKDLNTETTKYKNTAGQVVTVVRKTKNGVDSYKVSLKSTINNQKTFNEKLQVFGTIMNKVQLRLTTLIASTLMLANRLTKLIESAASEGEALNLFVVSLGENAEKGKKWIEEFSNALYLDPVQVMQYMGSFNSLIEGLGVGADRAYLMSQNLTQLVYDLSSFKNISIESAYEKLMSGISGELEPLRNVGVAMTEATLQTLAYELGIEKLVRNMTEAEKTQLRYIQIMRSSKEWQTDMGRTLIQPANALRVMRQQITLLGRAIGKIFIPLLIEIIPYVIAFTQLMTALAERIAKLFGYDIGDIFDYSQLGDISAGIDGIGDSAEETAKKLNTMLAPFDDLNVVQKKSEKAGSGLSGFGGDLGVDLPFYDALANLNTKFAERAEKAKKTLQDIIPIVTAIGLGLATWKITKSVIDFMSWWDGLTGSEKTAAKIALSITLMFLGYHFIKSGNEDVQNEETFLKGVGEQLFGSGTFGVAAGMITKNVSVGLFVGFALSGFTGSETASHGDWKNGLLGFLQQITGIAGIAGLAFKLSGGNIETTLAITALVTWANVLFDLAELLDLEPTWEEFINGVNELPWAKAISDYILTPLFIDLPNGMSDAFDNIKQEMSTKWDECWIAIGDSFNSERQEWSDNWLDFKNLTIGMWDIMGDDIETTWDETWVSIGNIIETKWPEAKNWFKDHFGTKEGWKKIFNPLTDGAGEKLKELKAKFENWSPKMKTPTFKWDDKDGFKASGVTKKILEALNLPTTIPKLKVKWYEDGGYPTSGDLFFANENGVPEMIGRIGNQTAVANNDQIATSLTNALISALDQYDFGGGKSPTTIYIGNRKVYEGYGDYVADENDRYGTNMIKI